MARRKDNAVVADHYCNCPLSCPRCARRFWQWAESHTRVRKGDRERPWMSFYEAAARHNGAPR